MKYKAKKTIDGKLMFEITEGQFKGTKYTYGKLDGTGLTYTVESANINIDENNKILFENEIRAILNDKLSKI